MYRKLLRIVLAVVLLALSSLACQALSGQPPLEGTWSGDYQGFEIVLVFNDNGSMIGYFNDDTGVGTYTVDYSTTPYQIDLVYEDQDAPVLTIFEFIDDNTIRMENNSPGEIRPASFSDYIVVRREQ